MKKVFPLFLLLSFPAHAKQILDLTHTFNKKTVYWPTAGGFELKKGFWGMNKKGYFQSGNFFSAPEHGGTHMDAPIHFNEKGWTIEKIPVENLVGEACVIHLADKIKDNADYLISKDDITQWEEKNGSLKPDCIVLFDTGWEKFWDQPQKFLGSAKKGDAENLHFPGLSKEASDYLVSKKIKGVGLDVASLDAGNSKDMIAHRTILGANIYGIENMANLEKLPPRGATLIVAPMKIENGTGAPTRIIAILPQ